ncbi:hypothetical protein L6452_13386 [Arctium lappa]|uniref:Uncharacterized protein n=1 Tax=Arctium lappa TaxID=4217 RepID=A0ACB9CI19_ARCLA|nr:hypothetical protein L6452_13386 [Arctium lappa]
MKSGPKRQAETNLTLPFFNAFHLSNKSILTHPHFTHKSSFSLSTPLFLSLKTPLLFLQPFLSLQSSSCCSSS